MILATPEQEQCLLEVVVRDCPLHMKDGTPLALTFILLKDWVNDNDDHYANVVISGIEGL